MKFAFANNLLNLRNPHLPILVGLVGAFGKHIFIFQRIGQGVFKTLWQSTLGAVGDCNVFANVDFKRVRIYEVMNND